MAKEIIFGQLRLTVASLTIEQINQDRESFLESVRKNVEPELNKIGLYLINVNITDITDESDYIESIGKKAASEAINKALVDVSINEKMGAIGQSEANRERDVRVAENTAQAVKGRKTAETDQRIYVQQREAEAVDGENLSKAAIANSNATLSVQEARASQQAEVARRDGALRELAPGIGAIDADRPHRAPGAGTERERERTEKSEPRRHTPRGTSHRDDTRAPSA